MQGARAPPSPLNQGLLFPESGWFWYCGRLSHAVQRGTVPRWQQACRKHVPSDRALAHFGMYSTEVIRGAYMGTFDLGRRRLPPMSRSILAAARGCGSLRLPR